MPWVSIRRSTHRSATASMPGKRASKTWSFPPASPTRSARASLPARSISFCWPARCSSSPVRDIWKKWWPTPWRSSRRAARFCSPT